MHMAMGMSNSNFYNNYVCIITHNLLSFLGKPQHNSSEMVVTHVFKDPAFWQHFQHQVQLRSWKCNFPSDILFKELEKDAVLYHNDTILRKRRQGIMNWMKNDTQWITLILGACKEIADGTVGENCQHLKKLHLLEALDDFVEHLNCFYTVATEMALKGKTVKPLSQDSSQIHDIDKLDPVMLTGYSERFEDNKVTSLWDACVDRHTHVNPHHQAHCLWQDNCCNDTCGNCEDIMEKALSEMVCDKVSRRLQKNLNGVISDDMWNVDLIFFNGLPQNRLDQALNIMKNMK